MDKLAVVVVHHRTPRLLRRCVHSIVHCTQPPSQLVVVDVAPLFGSTQVQTDWGNRSVSFLYSAIAENRGFGAACNAGAELVDADIIVFANADTSFTGRALEEMVRAFELDNTLGAVGPCLFDRDRDPAPSRFRFPRGPGRILFNMLRFRRPTASRAAVLNLPVTGDRPLPADWVLGAAFGVRQDAFRACRGFDEEFFLYFEEIDLCRRLAEAAWKVAVMPTARVFHYRSASSSLYPPETMQRIRYESQVRYFRKHHGWIGEVAARADRSCLRWRM